MREKKDLGELGEKIGERYLKDKDYRILDRNFRYSKLGELDIVAQKPARQSKLGVAGGDNNIVFFEVKARRKTGPSEFLPEDNITFTKQKKLIKLARIYLAKNLPAGRQENKDISWQIDVLAIEIYRNGTYDIRHTENAIGDFY